jgi:predicted nucleic acid-binding Zn ribbon protein
MICSKEFDAKGNIKTCSEDCRNIAKKVKDNQRAKKYMLKYKKITLQEKYCIICGEEFETYRTRQILCGKESCEKIHMKNLSDTYRKENKKKISNRRKIYYEKNKEAEKAQNKIRYYQKRGKSKKIQRNVMSEKKEKYKEANRVLLIQACAVCRRLFIKKGAEQKTCGETECKKTYRKIYQRKYKAYKRKLIKETY